MTDRIAQASRRPRAWIAAGAIAGLGLLAVLLPAVPTRGSAEAAGAQSQRARPMSRAARPIDISSPLGIADGDCVFAPELERAFADLLHRDGASVRPRPVRLGGMVLTPALTSAREEGVDDPSLRRYEASVRFGRTVTWNGLRLTALRESSGREWAFSEMDFADRPARVRAALRRMGIDVPASGRLDLPAEACATSLSVSARGAGATLSCGGGC